MAPAAPSPSRLSVHVRRAPEHVLVVADGEIDLGSAAQLQSVLGPLADAPGGDVVLDLADVTFLDSNALTVVLDAQDRLAGSRRELLLRRVRPHQRRLFEVAGVSGRVRFDDDQPRSGDRVRN